MPPGREKRGGGGALKRQTKKREAKRKNVAEGEHQIEGRHLHYLESETTRLAQRARKRGGINAEKRYPRKSGAQRKDRRDAHRRNRHHLYPKGSHPERSP